MLAAGRGDLSALAQLALRHQDAVWHVAYRFLGNTADAEDVAQEAFLRLLTAADRYRPAASFRTYLYRIVTNLCFDRLRRKRLRQCEHLSEVVDPRRTPAEASLASERSRIVRRALDALPQSQKMAVVLRYYEHLSHREIADALHTTTKGAERLLARARISLAGRLGEILEE